MNLTYGITMKSDIEGLCKLWENEKFDKKGNLR